MLVERQGVSGRVDPLIVLRHVPGTARRHRIFATSGGRQAGDAIYRPFQYRARAAIRAGWGLHRSGVTRRLEFSLAMCGLPGSVLGDWDDLALVDSPARNRILLATSNRGVVQRILKIAPSQPSYISNLMNEAELLRKLLHDPPEGLLFPEIVDFVQSKTHQVLITKAVRTTKATGSEAINWDAILATLAILHRKDLVHGDFAPWNLLPSHLTLVLLDWEHGRVGRAPFYDLTHYILQNAILLGRYTPGECARLLMAPGGPGQVLAIKLELDSEEVRRGAAAYLALTEPTTNRSSEFRASFATELTYSYAGPE